MASVLCARATTIFRWILFGPKNWKPPNLDHFLASVLCARTIKLISRILLGPQRRRPPTSTKIEAPQKICWAFSDLRQCNLIVFQNPKRPVWNFAGVLCARATNLFVRILFRPQNGSPPNLDKNRGTGKTLFGHFLRPGKEIYLFPKIQKEPFKILRAFCAPGT